MGVVDDYVYKMKVEKEKEMGFKERLEWTLKYLAETDLAAMAPGRYDLNEDVFILRQAYESKPSEICKFETHEKYVDIQWIIEG